jgi:glycerol-3-phosphate acyltransferase PlsX
LTVSISRAAESESAGYGPHLPVAVDAMGGDNAPGEVVAGARIASEEFGVGVLLVGRLEAMGDVGDLEVVEASEVIAMGAEPASSVRRMKDSSIVRAAEAVRDGRAKALLSAGNTGAAMASSLLRLGRIKGVSRPAIAVPFPVFGSTPATLLDCGANAQCQPEWLIQFAQLGTVYSRVRYGIVRPRVGVLSIGEEAGKGNDLVKEVAEHMDTGTWAAQCGAEFVGNIEGGDLMAGLADVVVCDGFTGNVILKSIEGAMAIAQGQLRGVMGSTPEAAEAALVLDSLVTPVFDTLDASKTGAAALLGTRGVCMIAHGSSSARTIANAIRTASEMADEGIVGHLRAAFEAPA